MMTSIPSGIYYSIIRREEDPPEARKSLSDVPAKIRTECSQQFKKKAGIRAWINTAIMGGEEGAGWYVTLSSWSRAPKKNLGKLLTHPNKIARLFSNLLTLVTWWQAFSLVHSFCGRNGPPRRRKHLKSLRSNDTYIYCIMVLWYYSIMVLWYYGIMVLWSGEL